LFSWLIGKADLAVSEKTSQLAILNGQMIDIDFYPWPFGVFWGTDGTVFSNKPIINSFTNGICEPAKRHDGLLNFFRFLLRMSQIPKKGR